jgi:cyclopropane-fatty-acyl-phospholipid synthase
MLNPKLSVGEAYMDGGLVSLGGSIHDVLEVVLANLRTNRKGPFVAWLRRAAVRVWRPINQFNARARARRNVAHHYDLNGRLYSLFLDRDRQYSCAYFPKGTETLEEAQEAKRSDQIRGTRVPTLFAPAPQRKHATRIFGTV